MANGTLIPFSPDIVARIAHFKDEMYTRARHIGGLETPQVDGSGRKIIRKKGGYDYVVESYMRDMLDKHFPGWSWEMAAPLQFLGAEWVVAQGTLTIMDEHLIPFGINPPVRKFYGVNAARITYGEGKAHTLENIIDIGNNVQSANSGALKRAISRLCHIADDVYAKRLDTEDAGTEEEFIESQVNLPGFQGQLGIDRWLKDNHVLYSKAFKLLGITNLNQLTDCPTALAKLREAKASGTL